ncbi:MAG TPA: outer membrane protein assembly factor BamA [Hyphomicrobiaceae bacterium]|nr:outer membrane protein assembly factor BamA [Hyphomicrobiaceae bacterium]
MSVAFLLSSSVPEIPRPRSGDRAGQLSARPVRSCLASAGAHPYRLGAAQGASCQGLLLIALAILLFGFLALPLYAAQTITAIEVKGNRTVDGDLVRSHVKLAPGGVYDAAKVSQSIKALFATGLFAHVTIERRGTSLLVVVAENPIVSAVFLEGNTAIDKAKLEEQVQLKPRARYTDAKGHADTLRLREQYRRLGRLTTTIEPSVTYQSDGRVEVTYVINEGAVTKVDAIRFVGNRALSEAQLRDVVSTSQSGWFDILKSAAFYDPERIEQDKDLLRRHYLKHGFPDARVVAAEAVQNPQGTGYTITFTVEEGERFTFAPTTVESSLRGADPAKLQELVAVKPGNAYSQEAIEKSVEKMTLALSDQGLAFAQVKPTPKRDAEGHTIAIAFHVEEGPRIYVERIEIVGNKKTQDFVIRREFRVAEGDAVNAFLIESGRRRVQALGFFKSVALKRRAGSAPEKIVITLEVVEQETINLGIGVGYSTSEGIVGDISIKENNLFGSGQSLGVKLSGSLVRLQAELGFTEPHLLGTNVAGGFDLFYKDVDYTQQASYMSQKIGGDLRLRYPLSDEWSAGVNYTFVRSTLYNVGDQASLAIKEAVPGYPNTTSSTYYTSSVGYSLAYDTRDNKKRPTSGVYYTIAQDLAGVGGDVRYIRSVGELRAYYPVTDEITAVGRATGGVIGGWGGQDVRLLDLFNMGGESVRGFATAGIGPRDVLSANQDALGGKMFYATTAELLFQLPGVPQDLGLRGAVFADAGSLWGVNGTAATLPGLAGNTATPRASVGIGLAWDSPIGALRADYAIPLVKQPSDKTQPFSFGLMPF